MIKKKPLGVESHRALRRAKRRATAVKSGKVPSGIAQLVVAWASVIVGALTSVALLVVTHRQVDIAARMADLEIRKARPRPSVSASVVEPPSTAPLGRQGKFTTTLDVSWGDSISSVVGGRASERVMLFSYTKGEQPGMCQITLRGYFEGQGNHFKASRQARHFASVYGKKLPQGVLLTGLELGARITSDVEDIDGHIVKVRMFYSKDGALAQGEASDALPGAVVADIDGLDVDGDAFISFGPAPPTLPSRCRPLINALVRAGLAQPLERSWARSIPTPPPLPGRLSNLTEQLYQPLTEVMGLLGQSAYEAKGTPLAPTR